MPNAGSVKSPSGIKITLCASNKIKETYKTSFIFFRTFLKIIHHIIVYITLESETTDHTLIFLFLAAEKCNTFETLLDLLIWFKL